MKNNFNTNFDTDTEKSKIRILATRNGTYKS